MKGCIFGSIAVSDPWELASLVGDTPVPVVVESLNRESATLRLVTPLQFEGKTFLTAVASARHLGRDFAENSGSVPANISFQSSDSVLIVNGIGTLTLG